MSGSSAWFGVNWFQSGNFRYTPGSFRKWQAKEISRGNVPAWRYDKRESWWERVGELNAETQSVQRSRWWLCGAIIRARLRTGWDMAKKEHPRLGAQMSASRMGLLTLLSCSFRFCDNRLPCHRSFPTLNPVD